MFQMCLKIINYCICTGELNEEIKADVLVVKTLQELEISFYCMLVEVMSYLQKNCTDKLIRARFFLNVYTHTEDFSSCDNFEKLMHQLQQKHISIFNISKLQLLCTKYFEEHHDLMKIVQAYEKEKQDFFESTTVLCFQRALVSRVEPILSQGSVIVTIVIPEVIAREQTLKNIENLAKEGFKDCHKSLIHLHIKAGSIIISWVFPEALSVKLALETHKNAAIFKDAGVVEVTIGGMRVYSATQKEVRQLQVDS